MKDAVEAPDRLITGVEATEVLRRLQEGGQISDALIREQLAAVQRDLRGGVHLRLVKATAAKRELEPAELEQLIGQIRDNFMCNNRDLPLLHPNTRLDCLERAIRVATPSLLLGLNKMEIQQENLQSGAEMLF